METLLRQWTMLEKIPRYPSRITTTELLEKLTDAGHPTTLRTVQRDLEKLSVKFQIASDEGKPACWYWLREAVQFNIPGLSSHSALVFKMVQKHLCPLLPRPCLDLLQSHFDQSEKVLAGIRPQPLANWPDKVVVRSRALSLRPPHIDPDVLFAVYQGLLGDRQLRVLYRRRGDDHAEERVVNPLGLVVVDQVHYLVGTLWDYADIRHLAIHRMEAVTELDSAALIPEGFDLQAYADSGEFGYPAGDRPLTLKALFDAYTAEQFKETPLSPDQKLTRRRDGRVLLEARVGDTAQLRWWLQGFGAAVEVLGPQKLREEFTDMSRRLAALYAPASRAQEHNRD